MGKKDRETPISNKEIFLGEITNSRARARKVQDEPEISMVLENESVLKNDGRGASLKRFPKSKSEIIRW